MTHRVSRRRGASFEFCGVDEIARLSPSPVGGRTSERFELVRLESAWGRAVGAQLRAVAHPSSWRARRLVVDVRDTSWMRELDRLKPQILARLAAILPGQPPADISFRVRSTPSTIPSASDVVDRRPETSAARPRAAAQPAAAVGSVGEQDLRIRFTGVMGRYLARVS